MEHSANDWKMERICSLCGHRDELYVSKRAAAFGLVNIEDALGRFCRRCSSTAFSGAYQMPELDFELLKEWATNLDLCLMEQDEELLLADVTYLDMILRVLDTMTVPEQKRNTLLEALCVIVYDNSVSGNSRRDDELRNRVVDELNKRQDLLKSADRWISDYIKKVVYPQLAFGT